MLLLKYAKRDRYDNLTQNSNLEYGDKLHGSYYMVKYKINTENVDDSNWNPPRISAVQLSAAITAYSRIYMYKYISRPDCFYTDTDSVVLANPLPEDEISSSELGKFKLEHKVMKGFFLASKTYSLKIYDGKVINKHKGAGKDFINNKWFEEQYNDPSRTQIINIIKNFRIDWNQLDIYKQVSQLKLGIQIMNKRNPVYDNNNKWVDTKPLNIIDYGGQEKDIKLLLSQLENQSLKEELEKMKNQIESMQEKSQMREEKVTRLTGTDVTRELEKRGINDSSKARGESDVKTDPQSII